MRSPDASWGWCHHRAQYLEHFYFTVIVGAIVLRQSHDKTGECKPKFVKSTLRGQVWISARHKQMSCIYLSHFLCGGCRLLTQEKEFDVDATTLILIFKKREMIAASTSGLLRKLRGDDKWWSNQSLLFYPVQQRKGPITGSAYGILVQHTERMYTNMFPPQWMWESQAEKRSHCGQPWPPITLPRGGIVWESNAAKSLQKRFAKHAKLPKSTYHQICITFCSFWYE